ncbi:hypothetical protein [Duganella violaceipulchra]|uniref:Ribbon-helix-helix protein, CopG family n=1 Tax=Duganella violaceipulchra TaxID=2849652 RepID=A0AA41HBK4_9BURK|nr:hypothetical protein [Duganella violaceicalia]MBV6324375.1 hypothetical protein [Duganella violaceicalia]MCP2007231.1 hypothetical protein [Duganella violaceicalia]
MRQPNDTKTSDLLGDSCDLAGPVPVKSTQREKAAERARRFRERHGVVAMTVNIKAETLAAFNEWAAAKGKNKAQVIERLIETQLLRKR